MDHTISTASSRTKAEPGSVLTHTPLTTIPDSTHAMSRATRAHGRSIQAQHVKRILLLGASGRTGRHVIDYALMKGLDVVALVRNADRVITRSRRLAVMIGSPLNPADVAEAIGGCEAVISTLGHTPGFERPWAHSLSPPLLLTDCIANCINAMRKQGIGRIVVLSASGARNSWGFAPAIFRRLLPHANLQRTCADHYVLEQLLRQSGLAWTSVRAVKLSNGKRLGKLIVTLDNRPKSRGRISRALAARFLVHCLSSLEYVGQTPSLSEFQAIR